MRKARRENISTVPGHQVWRRRARLPLTPREMRTELQAARRWRPTTLDGMLHDDESRVLELWAENEMLLSGRASTSSCFDLGPVSGRRSDTQPIPDSKVNQVIRHMEFKKSGTPDHLIPLLDAFTAVQNKHEGALSSTQYGLVFCPDARNKAEAFFQLLRNAAKFLVDIGY